MPYVFIVGTVTRTSTGMKPEYKDSVNVESDCPQILLLCSSVETRCLPLGIYLETIVAVHESSEMWY